MLIGYNTSQPSPTPRTKKQIIIFAIELLMSVVFFTIIAIFSLNFFNLIRLDSYNSLFAFFPHYQEVSQDYTSFTDPTIIFSTYTKNNIKSQYQPLAHITRTDEKNKQSTVFKWNLSSGDPLPSTVTVTFDGSAKLKKIVFVKSTLNSSPINSSLGDRLINTYFTNIGDFLNWHCSIDAENNNICYSTILSPKIKRSYLISRALGTNQTAILACLVPNVATAFSENNCFGY